MFLLLFWYFFASTQFTSYEKSVIERKNLNSEVSILQAQINKIDNQKEHDLTAKLKNEKKTAMAELASLNKGVSKHQDESVSEKQIFVALRNLTEKEHGLELISLKSLPPKPLVSTDAGNFFEYPIELVLVGDFASIYQYFQSVEQLNLNLYWQDMHYMVTNYPYAEVQLKCYVVKFQSNKGQPNEA